MSKDTRMDERKVYIRIVLDPGDPMDRIIIEEVKKQKKKKSRFVKFAVFCYIKGIDLSAPLPRQTNNRDGLVKAARETDPAVTRAIREIEDIEL